MHPECNIYWLPASRSSSRMFQIVSDTKKKKKKENIMNCSNIQQKRFEVLMLLREYLPIDARLFEEHLCLQSAWDIDTYAHKVMRVAIAYVDDMKIPGDETPHAVSVLSDHEIMHLNMRDIAPSAQSGPLSVPEFEHTILQAMINCKACGSSEIRIVQRQLRSADEGMTSFCECKQCGEKWKD